MLHDAIDDLGRKTSYIVNGGELPRWHHHARIRIDRQWKSHVHVHVIQPVIVGLRQTNNPNLTIYSATHIYGQISLNMSTYYR